MGKRIIPIFLIFILLTGCHQKHTAVFPVVTGIEVIREDTGHRRIYTGEDDMRPILNALRLLGHRYRPHLDPESLDGPVWSIKLFHSDSSTKQYRTKAGLYIQEDRAHWQQTDPERLAALMALLEPSL